MDSVVHRRLQDYLERGDLESARDLSEALHPASVADVVTMLPPDGAVRLLARLGARRRAEVFVALDEPTQDRLAAALDLPALAELVAQMPHDERADLLPRLPSDRAVPLLRALAVSEREDIRRLAAYPEGTAGAVMTSEYATLGPDLTAREAVERLRVEAPDRETI